MPLPTAGPRMARIIFLYALTAAVIVVAMLVPPVAQPLSFHHFADGRYLLGIPNCCNVLSNVIFLWVGIKGFMVVYRSHAAPEFRVIYYALFFGVVLTSAGSAVYHLSPDNATLVSDRLPMVMIFMPFLAAVIAEWISPRAGFILLPFLLVAGIASVCWWQATEARGRGDLRPYLVVQFYPMLLIPLILLFFMTRKTWRGLTALCAVLAWYIVAKILEAADEAVYRLTGFISGHTLKHLAAGVATAAMVGFFLRRHVSGEDVHWRWMKRWRRRPGNLPARQ